MKEIAQVNVGFSSLIAWCLSMINDHTICSVCQYLSSNRRFEPFHWFDSLESIINASHFPYWIFVPTRENTHKPTIRYDFNWTAQEWIFSSFDSNNFGKITFLCAINWSLCPTPTLEWHSMQRKDDSQLSKRKQAIKLTIETIKICFDKMYVRITKQVFWFGNLMHTNNLLIENCTIKIDINMPQVWEFEFMLDAIHVMWIILIKLCS